MFRRCTPFQTKECMEWTNQSEDWVFMSATRLDERQPLYKPEHWDKIIELDQWTNKYDPVMTCLPLGIPRQGPPARIFHTENDISMIYRAASTAPAVRGVPYDPARRETARPRRALQYTYMGYTVGKWEGDTLVLDSIGFSDETWLGRGGWFHSDQMRVIEKFTRTGTRCSTKSRSRTRRCSSSPGSCLHGPCGSPTAIRSSRSGKLHGERTERGQLPDAALSPPRALLA